MSDDALTDQQLTRYAKQMILPSMPEDAQDKFLMARVLIVGLGGLGCPVASFLSRAGIGNIGLIDPDRVELGNIHRQILYDDEDIGRFKAEVAAEKASYAAPDCVFQPYISRIQDVKMDQDWDFVVDCCDNYAARLASAEYAKETQTVLLSASILGFNGQITTILPDKDSPSFVDLYPEAPEEAPSQCEQIGVIGPAVGILGSLLAMELMKMIAGIGENYVGKVMLWDGLHNRVQFFDL